PGTRPNAGWLYYTDELRRENPSSGESLQLTFGVTGPPSLGSYMQARAHAFAPRLNRPIDWSSQIQFEPGVIVRYQPQQMLRSAEAGRFGAQLLPSASVSVGNVLTEATGAVQARLGFQLDQPWRLAQQATAPELAVYASATGHAIAHDMFLDGNTFRDSPSV